MNQKKSVNEERHFLYSQLWHQGEFLPMKMKIDIQSVQQEIKNFDENWVPYNIQRGDTGRMGLSVTSLDGGLSGYPDLQSLYQYSHETGKKVSENDFSKLTAVYDKMPSLHGLLDYFKNGLGRSRFVKFRAGGHFPPHRDQSVSHVMPDYFRIFVPLCNTGEKNLVFIYDGQPVSFEPGRCYLFNALKVHSVFSFRDDALTLALSVRLTQQNVSNALQGLLDFNEN